VVNPFKPREKRSMPLPYRILAFAALLGLALPIHAQDRPGDVSGSWIFTVVTENGTGTPAVTLEQEGERIRGTYSSDRLGDRPLQGTMKGDTLTFVLMPGADGMGVPLTFVGTLRGDGSIHGAVDFDGMGGATFTARRRPS
jgi:hypothetical protein